MEEPQKIRDIVRIWCPHCKKQEMYKTTIMPSVFEREGRPSESWRCSNCVYIYDDRWFNKFGTFEQNLLREGDNLKEWAQHNKIPEEVWKKK